MTGAIQAASPASASTVFLTEVLFETGLKQVTAYHTAESALWQKQTIFSSSGRQVALTSKLINLSFLLTVER